MHGEQLADAAGEKIAADEMARIFADEKDELAAIGIAS